jgi:hypothetical protein
MDQALGLACIGANGSRGRPPSVVESLVTVRK